MYFIKLERNKPAAENGCRCFNFRGSCSSAQLSVKPDQPIGRHPRETHPHVKFVPELQSKKLASQTKNQKRNRKASRKQTNFVTEKEPESIVNKKTSVLFVSILYLIFCEFNFIL